MTALESSAILKELAEREVEITGVTLAGPDGTPGHVFQSGERLDVKILMRAPLPIDDFVVGFGLFNAEGVCCYGTNTYIEELAPERLAGDAEAIFSIDSLDLVEGTYKLDVAVHKIRPRDFATLAMSGWNATTRGAERDNAGRCHGLRRQPALPRCFVVWRHSILPAKYFRRCFRLKNNSSIEPAAPLEPQQRQQPAGDEGVPGRDPARGRGV